MRIAPTLKMQSDPPCNRGTKEVANKTSKLRARLLIRLRDRDTLGHPTSPRRSTAICRARRRSCRTLRSTPSTLRVLVILCGASRPFYPNWNALESAYVESCRQRMHAKAARMCDNLHLPHAHNLTTTALGARYGSAVLVDAETAKRPVTATLVIIAHHVDRILHAVQAEEPSH